MINIIVNYEKGQLELEGHKSFEFNSGIEIEGIEIFLKNLLDEANYSGETICLETYSKKEGFKEIDRW